MDEEARKRVVQALMAQGGLGGIASAAPLRGILSPSPEPPPPAGILGLGAATANPLLMRQFANQRAAYPRQQLNTPQQAFDLGAGLLSPVPILGDAMGLAADMNRYREDPSSRTWLNFGLTGLGLLPFMPGMTVFHGSPHKFDKFDMSKVGTGEGAAAYGHGLYFSENQKVANSYAKELGGKTYKVDLPDEAVGKMLDWNLPLSQQPDHVKDTLGPMYRDYLAKNGTPRGALDYHVNRASGEDIYKALMRNRGSKATSEMLRKAGIPGIKYLDQGSRGAPGGSHNFVVFDDSLPKIQE